MAPALSEDEIDDLLYLARVGEKDEFVALQNELCGREKCTVTELLEAARDTETNGNGVLHMAAANGHDGKRIMSYLASRVTNTCVALLTILLDSLSKPSPQNPAMLAILNAQNKSGNTALHWAALNGHLESVKKLLESGADPTITNQKGHDAVYEAELNDKKEVVEWVLKEGGEGLEEGFGGDTEDIQPMKVNEEEEEEPSKTANGSTKLEDTMDKMDIKEGSPSVAA